MKIFEYNEFLPINDSGDPIQLVYINIINISIFNIVSKKEVANIKNDINFIFTDKIIKLISLLDNPHIFNIPQLRKKIIKICRQKTQLYSNKKHLFILDYILKNYKGIK